METSVIRVTKGISGLSSPGGFVTGRRCSVCILLLLAFCNSLWAQSGASALGLRATIKPRAYHIPMGQPIWVEFSLENETSGPITVMVPNTQPRIPEPEISLPLSHIFSSGGSSGVTIRTHSGREWDRPVGYRLESEAPILMLGPRGVVGRTIDLREYFPALRATGQYRITWRPYAGEVGIAAATITIAPRKRVEMVTDHGTLAIELHYDEAPLNVANFLDLVGTNFFSGLTFHRVIPGYMIQSGCPRGDGSGIRPDGKRVPAEFNDLPHQRGSISMALLDDNPDSASSQFFICYTRQADWDGRYTVFGRLVGDASHETLDRLMSVPIDEYSRPRETLYIRNAYLTDAPSAPMPSTWP